MSTHVDADAERVPDRVGIVGSETERVVLRDDSSVLIRQLTAGDDASIISWFASRFSGLSPEALFARSLALLQWLDPRVDSRLARVERFDQEAVTAWPRTASWLGSRAWCASTAPGART